MATFSNRALASFDRHGSRFRLSLAFSLCLMLCCSIDVEAQCTAGTGLSGVTCAPCKGGFYCPTGSLNVYGETGVGNFTLLAGSTTSVSTDGIGTSALFTSPIGIAIHSNDEFALIADSTRIRKMYISSGAVSTIAGSGSTGSADGIGVSATFQSLYGLALDATNTFALVSDSMSHRIRRIDIATVTVTTLAGYSSGFLDAVGTSASFSTPNGIALDSTGVFALVADNGNHRIRRIEISTGAVSTLAGSSMGSLNGVGTSAFFNSPCAVAIAGNGLFALVADTSNNIVRRIEIATRVVTTVAGSSISGSNDGIGVLASFFVPISIAIDASNNVALVADYGTSAIRHIQLVNSSVTRFAAGSLSSPKYVAASPKGTIALISENSNSLGYYRIRVSPFSSTCNSGNYCPVSSPSASSQLPCNAGYYCPAGSSSATQSACPGGYYCPAGTPSKLICNAGTYCSPGSASAAAQLNCSSGYYCPAGSSSATQVLCTAGFYCPAGSPIMLTCSAGYYCPAGSSSSTQVICDAGYYCPPGSTNATGLIGTLPQGLAESECVASLNIQHFFFSNILFYTAGVSSIAGGSLGGFVDGIGTSVKFVGLLGVSVASNGLFALVADTSNIRRLDLISGLVSTVAGQSGTNAGNLDGIGTNAKLNGANGVCVSPNTLFALVADTSNNCIRHIIITTGLVSTLAGSTSSVSGVVDAIGTFASFNRPTAIAISGNGSFALVVDSSNNRIRRIELSTNVVSTFAGSSSGSTDGVGIAAKFNTPYGIAIDPSSTFCLVADSQNNAIRRIDLASRAVSILAGSASQTPGFFDGIGTLASFYSPRGIAIDSLGTFAMVCDSGNNRIRRVNVLSGLVTTVTGSSIGGSTDGALSDALFALPSGISTTPDGANAIVVESVNARIRRITLPTICTGGYYCPSGSSSGTQFICDAGYYCPAGTSAASAKIICSGGYYCPAGSSSATPNICNSGSYCPAGSSSSSAAVTCNAGYYCPAGSSSPTQTPCKSGFYCPVGSSMATLVCTAGYYCPTGSTSPMQVLLPPQSTQLAAFNPITSTNAVNQDSILSSVFLFAVCFGPFVLFIIVVGVGFEKYPNVKQFISTNIAEKYCLSFQWSSLDLFFSDIHFRHTGKPISIRQTTFGASMSLATIVSIIGVGCILGFNSIKFPSYSSTISPQPPPWQPAGVFQLIVTVFGAGIDSCATNGFGITSSASDWSISPTPVPNVFNPVDGSCQLTWRCEGQCKMTASSYALFQLTSPAGAWATFVKYQLSTPMFATSSGGTATDFGSVPYSLSGGFYPPPSGTGPNSNATAFRGFSPTVVSLSVTPTVINSSAVATSSVTFEPSLVGVTPGSTVKWNALDAPSNDVFMIHFQLNLNVLSFVYVSVSSQMATFLVLLSSVAGSIITAFAVLVKQLEAKFDMREDSDQTSVESSKTPDSDPASDPSALAVGIEMTEFDSVQKPEAPLTMESKFAELEQKIDREIALSQSKTFRELAMADQIQSMAESNQKFIAQTNLQFQIFQEQFKKMQAVAAQNEAKLDAKLANFFQFQKYSASIAENTPVSSGTGSYPIVTSPATLNGASFVPRVQDSTIVSTSQPLPPVLPSANPVLSSNSGSPAPKSRYAPPPPRLARNRTLTSPSQPSE